MESWSRDIVYPSRAASRLPLAEMTLPMVPDQRRESWPMSKERAVTSWLPDD